MKNVLQLKTLDSKIYFIFTILFFIMILSMQIVFYYYFSTSIKSSAGESNRILLNRLVTQLDSYVESMEQIIENIKNENKVIEYLQLSEIENDEISRNNIEQELKIFHKAREEIYSIALFGYNKKIIINSGIDTLNEFATPEKAQWYIGASKKDGKLYISSSYVQNIIKGQYSWVISISKEINNMGIILIDLKFNKIRELCNSLTSGKKGYIFILDQFGNYIYHPSQQLIYSGIKKEPIQTILSNNKYSEEGKNYNSLTSEKTGWQICSVSFDEEIMDSWKHIQYYYVLIGLVAFIIIGFAASLITKSITRPVRKLCNAMKRVEKGEFKEIEENESTIEIRELTYEYNIMIGKINELMQTIVLEHESKIKSDFKALQAQINPHFLYNTLDSIIWMGEMGHSDEVVRMTSALSKLFRISISKGKEIISIEEEIAHVTSYLTIQEMRYRNKFNYIINIENGILQCQTIKIILQPLVENAIYHGIKNVDHKGLIEITGYREKDYIIMKVTDNGKGFNEEELSSILDKNNSSTEQGTGIKNVHERIRLYFGNSYGLSCTSIKNTETVISVMIPLITD